jgi:glycosyltransferase involved in cell wall biosynthesis
VTSLKVVFVINGLGTGGSERSTAEMLPFLVEAGITPIVVCLYSRQEGIEKGVRSNEFDVRILSGGNLFQRVRELRRLITIERPDVVHTTIFEANITGRFASAFGGRPPVITSLVSTPYSKVRLRDPNIKAMRLSAVRMIDGWSARHFSTHFHAVSSAVERAAVEGLKIAPDRISVIHRGRAAERLGRPSFRRRIRARGMLGIPNNCLLLINVARHEFAKGQHHLLEAMVPILIRHPESVLLVAGRKGHASQELERLRTTLGLSDRVRFLGHREDVPDLLAAADVFVFPSLWEGLPGAVIEAMALGLPIIASDLDATREVVEEGRNALLVRPSSPHALAEALLELMDDQQRRQSFGARSRQIFEDRFTIDRSARLMIELYRRVADNASGDRCAYST